MRAHDGDMFDDEIPCEVCGRMAVNDLCGDCDEMIAVLTFGLDVDDMGEVQL